MINLVQNRNFLVRNRYKIWCEIVFYPGHDTISTYVIKEFEQLLTPHITKVINLAIMTSTYPQIWTKLHQHRDGSFPWHVIQQD